MYNASLPPLSRCGTVPRTGLNLKMAIEFSHDSKTGRIKISYTRHVFTAVGVALIVSGFAALSGPWWQAILEALLGKVGFTVDDKYQWVIAVCQIVPGFFLVGYKHFKMDRDIARNEADRKNIQAINLDFDRLRYYLSNLVDDHSYHSSLNSTFSETLRFFSLPENRFQSRLTASSFDEFAKAGTELQNFVAGHFYVFPNSPSLNGDWRYCMEPQMNMDRDMVRYDPDKSAEYSRLGRVLHELVLRTEKCLHDWILHMKEVGIK